MGIDHVFVSFLLSIGIGTGAVMILFSLLGLSIPRRRMARVISRRSQR